MYVAVGSTNPVKRAAVEAAFEAVAGVTVEPENVASGVSDQPMGHEETVTGAETRARRALEAGAYDLGVGLEGGVAEFDGAPGLYLVMWAAVTDGQTTGRGAGPSVRLPEQVAGRVRDGAALGPVMDDAFGLDNGVETRGAIGVLTGDLVDRQDALRTAVAGALGPFVTDCY